MTPLRRFRPQDTVAALFSPSGSIRAFPRRTARAIDFVRRSWGGVDTSALDELAGDPPPEVRAETLHRLLRDPTVGLILTTTGGYTSLCVLDHIDRDLVAAARKPIVGFSDVTALVLGLNVSCGLVTFHGPTALSNFGELGSSQSFAAESILRAAGGPTRQLAVEDPPEAHDLFRFWDSEDEGPPPMEPSPPRITLRSGRAEGVLLGGNLETLLAMAATPYAPAWRGSILFWEACFGNAEKLDRDLCALELAGVFREIAGMVVGRPFRISDASEQDVYRRAAVLADRYAIPAIAGMAIGHTTPCTTVPIGATATLDADLATLTIQEEISA